MEWVPPFEFSFVYQLLGREKEARAYMAEALKINPGLSLEWVKMVYPYNNPAHLQRELDARRKAGMPEKAPRAVQSYQYDMGRKTLRRKLAKYASDIVSRDFLVRSRTGRRWGRLAISCEW